MTSTYTRRLSSKLAVNLFAATTAGIFLSTLPARASEIISHINVSGRNVALASAPSRDDDGRYIADAEFIRAMGADYSVMLSGTAVSLRIGGRTIIEPCIMRAGRALLRVEAVSRDMGASCSVNPEQHSLDIRSKIRMVREDGNTLSVETSYPTEVRTGTLSAPDRVYVDLVGATLGAPSADIPVDGDNVQSIRSNQINANTVRIVMNLKSAMTVRTAGSGSTRIAAVLSDPFHLTAQSARPPVTPVLVAARPVATDVGRVRPLAGLSAHIRPPAPPARIAQLPLRRNDDAGDSRDSPAPDSTPVDGLRITNIETNSGTPGILQVVVSTAGNDPDEPAAYKAFMLDNPLRLAIDLQDASMSLPRGLAEISSNTLTVTSSPVKAVRWGILPGSDPAVARVVIDLRQAVSYTISTTSGSNGVVRYVINVLEHQSPVIQHAPPPVAPIQPFVSGAPLSGKTVIVDPGHGGHDGGAPGVHGIWEKNLTLAIGKLLRDQLTQSGARVLMTRSDDTFIPLPDRSQLGVSNHADFFVSIHCDSSGVSNSHSGCTVYYHANSSSCRSMASSIASRMEQLNDGIRSDGVRSDYVRFPGVGFSVLRRSPEPSVLVECGYVNTDSDARQLSDPSVQKLVAEAITAGLKDYIVRESGTRSVASASAGAFSLEHR